METQEKTLSVSAVSEQHVELKVTFISADAVNLHFAGLTNNDPNKFSNFAGIWQDTAIEYDTAPAQKFPFDSNYHNRSGDFNFQSLTINKEPYTVGYAVGPQLDGGQKFGNMCSAAYIPSGASDPSDCTYEPTTLALGYLGSSSVAVKFKAPRGYNAKTNGCWIGIWRDAVSYTTNPAAAAKIDIDASSGTGAINGFQMGVGNTYAIAIFMAGWNEDPAKRSKTNMASVLTFDVV